MAQQINEAIASSRFFALSGLVIFELLNMEEIFLYKELTSQTRNIKNEQNDVF